MGIIVLAVAILPLLGVGGSQLFKAESPGCMKDTKLTPRIGDTAKGLWAIYAAVTAACIVSLHVAGMSWVDCVRQLKPLLPQTQVVMLTVYENTELIFDSLKAGATGYLDTNYAGKGEGNDAYGNYVEDLTIDVGRGNPGGAGGQGRTHGTGRLSVADDV